MNKKEMVFFRNGSLPVPRAIRMMRIAKDLNYKAYFVGAKRENKIDDFEVWEDFEIYRVGKKYPLLNGKGMKLYLKYTYKFSKSLYSFFKKKSPDVLVASDFEVMVPAIIFSIIFRKKLIFNIHDNLAQRYNVPKIVYWFLNTIEGIAVLFSNSALVPEDFRKKSLPFWCQKKVKIVKNIPGKINFYKPKIEGKKIKLFYGGWLNENRGIFEMISLVNKHKELTLDIAGSGSEEMINLIESNPRVNYLGYLTHEETLERTKKAHFIPIFYNPEILINRYAASNKLAETLGLGRPLLVNSELEILKSFSEFNCVLPFSYKEIPNIGNLIIDTFHNKSKYLELCNNSRMVYEKLYSWEDAKNKMIDIIEECS